MPALGARLAELLERHSALTAEDVRAEVDGAASALKDAGATLPRRDSLDQRIIKETRTGRCTFGDSYGPGTGIIDSQNSVGAWPLLRTYDVRADSDGDGMPDNWELKMGLNPADPEDRNRLAGSGYTMLEEYINGLCK